MNELYSATKKDVDFNKWIEHVNDCYKDMSTGVMANVDNGGWSFLYDNGSTAEEAAREMIR